MEPATTADSTSLITELGVRAFRRGTLDAETGTFSWQAPAGTSFVVCALFGCAPHAVQLEQALLDDTRRRSIENFFQCALDYEITQGDVGEFVLSQRHERPATEITCTDAPIRRQPVAFTTLQVGCWAYDATHIVAASRLAGVSPALLQGSDLGIPMDATCSSDFQGCYSEVVDHFGLCSEGACMPRCLQPSDCLVQADLWFPSQSTGEDAGPGGPPDGGVNAWECLHETAQTLLGVCRPSN